MAAGIPTYDVPQVRPEALGAPDTRSVASPDLLGAEATQRLEAGKSLLAAGAGASAVAYQMQERETADAVMRAETKLKDDYIKQEQEWRQSRQGRFAKDLTRDAGAWFDEQLKAGNELLKDNPDAQRLFNRRASALKMQGVAASSLWESRQMEASHDEAWAADKGATKSKAAASPSVASVDAARAEIARLNAYQAARKGWEGSALEAANDADLTDLHKQVIQQIAQTDPKAAVSYFERYKNEIDGAQQAEIGGFARKATASSVGEDAAGRVWGELGPKSDAAPVELDRMEAQIRKEFKGDEYAMKAGLQALRERAAAHNSSQAERAAGNVNAVMELYRKGASMNAIERTPEYQALPGKQKAEIQQHISDRNHMLWARSISDRAALEAEQMRTFSAGFHSYSNPEVLANMTRTQVQALEPVIGRQYTDTLLNKWEAIQRKDGGLSEARIDNDAFKTHLRAFGFDPDKKLDMKKDGDKTEAARMGAMRDEVERQIGIAQQEKKRQLTREEKDDIARATLSRSVLRSKWFGLSSEEVPAASVVPADLKKVVVPPTDRERIKEELMKRNKPATDEEIARWYILGQRRGVKQ